MLAEKNAAIAEAAQTMYRLSEDDLVRERCESRQEHYRILQTYEDQFTEHKRILQTYEDQFTEHKRILQTYEDQFTEHKRILQTYEDQFTEHKRILQTYEDEAKKNKETIQALSSENTLLVHLITSKLKTGKSLEQIAAEVEMSVDDIRPLYEHIKQEL